MRNFRIQFYKQLGSGLGRENCLYFHGFWGSKLLDGCFGVSEELNSIQDSKSIFMISDFKFFPKMV